MAMSEYYIYATARFSAAPGSDLFADPWLAYGHWFMVHTVCMVYTPYMPYSIHKYKSSADASYFRVYGGGFCRYMYV